MINYINGKKLSFSLIQKISHIKKISSIFKIKTTFIAAFKCLFNVDIQFKNFFFNLIFTKSYPLIIYKKPGKNKKLLITLNVTLTNMVQWVSVKK